MVAMSENVYVVWAVLDSLDDRIEVRADHLAQGEKEAAAAEAERIAALEAWLALNNPEGHR